MLRIACRAEAVARMHGPAGCSWDDDGRPAGGLACSHSTGQAPAGSSMHAVSGPRFTISAEFRRNSGKNSVSASYREEKFRYFSVNFVSKFKNSKKL